MNKRQVERFYDSAKQQESSLPGSFSAFLNEVDPGRTGAPPHPSFLPSFCCQSPFPFPLTFVTKQIDKTLFSFKDLSHGSNVVLSSKNTSPRFLTKSSSSLLFFLPFFLLSFSLFPYPHLCTETTLEMTKRQKKM